MIELTGWQELDLVVFWGSQSGRAESFASNLARECSLRYGLKSRALDLDDFDHKHLAEVTSKKLVVFIVSTFGQGDPTDNAIKFQSTLAALYKSEQKDLFANLNYAAFGLGNKNYKHFNKIVDDVDDTLQRLGATRLGVVGRADEARGNQSTEEDFDDWKGTLLEEIKLKFGTDESVTAYVSEFEVVPTNADLSTVFLGEPAGNLRINEKEHRQIAIADSFVAPVVRSKNFECNEASKCVYLEFDISKAPAVKYQTGDHLAIYPINPNLEVERLSRLLGLDQSLLTETVAIQSKTGNLPPIPTPTTRETILRYYLDICGPVSRDTLRLLSSFCPDQNALETISTLARDKVAFRDEVSQPCLTIGQVLEKAGGSAVWKELPFGMLVDCVGKLLPRLYSIASSTSVSPRHPSIAVSVTSKTLDASKPDVQLKGVASNYLYQINKARLSHQGTEKTKESVGYHLQGPRAMLSGQKVLISLRRSAFRLPPNPTRPVIMVAAGTGVAPFRGFVQERAAMAAHGISVGPMLLLFGCRSTTDGFLFKDEWASFASQLPSFEMQLAFSRVGDKSQYVQDLLLQMRERVSALLEQGAAFYICGSADMARVVRNRLMEIISQSKGWDEQKAERYVMGEMKQAKLLQEDVWSS